MRKTAMSPMLARITSSCVTALLGGSMALWCVSAVNAADYHTAVIAGDSQTQLEQRALVPPGQYLPPEEITAPQAPGPFQTQAVGATYRVYATREGLVGHQTANGHWIVSNDHFVALPSSSALNGNGGYTYTVTIANPANGRQSSNVPVWDVGPWNVTDNYWHSPRVSKFSSFPVGTPAAQIEYQNGWLAENGYVPSNPAGIDLADGTWSDLAMSNNGYVDVTFNWEAPPTPTYANTYNAQSYPATMVAGSSATAWAEFTNTGTGHWTHGSTRLGTSSPQDRSSPFYYAGNWIAANRPSDVDQTDVAQGAVGRFTFMMRAPTTPGTYTEHFKVVQEGVTWFGSEVTWVITVTAANGNITGTVTNSYNGQPIAGATVTISGVASTSTDGSGVYTLANLNAGTYTLNVSANSFGSTSGTATVTVGQTTTRNFSLTSTDTTAPSAPSGLGASSVSPSQIDLGWTGSSDSGGSGLAGYIIYRGGAEVGRTASTTYSDNGLAQNTAYSYYVKAYDNAGNVSGQSNTGSATTKPGSVPIFQDGFGGIDGNLWQAIQQSPMPSPYPLVFDGGINHGSFAGGGSIKTLTSTDGNQGCLLGHAFDPAFATAKFDTWFYDSSTNDSSRQGLEVRCIMGGGVKAIYYVGTYSAAPGSASTYSVGYYKACGSGCTGWYWQGQVKTRVIGWHKFSIDFQPYTGALNEVTFYIDDVKMGNSVERTIDTQTYGLNMVSYGYHYRVNVSGWFDDCAMYASPPVTPTMNAPAALSENSIRWNLTDHSNNEMGFKIVNAAQATVATATVSSGTSGAVSIDEGALASNTPYTRTAKAFNGTLDSLPTSSATRWTLSAAPSASNVTCNRTAGTSSSSPDFTFTAVGGFGQGTVSRYRYVCDTNPTHAWSESEAIWDSGRLMIQASSSGTYYLHVKGYNGEGVANGTLDLGPYGYLSGPVVDKIATALALTDGTPMWFQGKPVTAVFSGAFCIEDPDRTSGMKVVSGATVARGDLVTIYGAPGMSGVQRAFIASYVAKTGTGAVPKPLLMTTRWIGGSSPSDTTPGTTNGRSLYNVGLLARVIGHVTYSNSTDPSNRYFYIDDGAGLSDGSGHLGVLVRCGSVSPPSTGTAAATGIVGLEQAGAKYVPVVIIRDASDIRAF